MENGDIELTENEDLKSKIVDVVVSVDGSWSSRGWTVRDGLSAVISIDTGKVLDITYLTNSCVLCEQKKRQRDNDGISRMEYLQWCIQHEESCLLNHDGSSQVNIICLNEYNLCLK